MHASNISIAVACWGETVLRQSGWVLPIFLAGTLLLIGSVDGTETVVVTGNRGSADLCIKIAEAKFNQWLQDRVHTQQTMTYDDGSTKSIEIIATPNIVYARHGSVWGSSNVTLHQRVASSPEKVAKDMNLDKCAIADHLQEQGQAATVYTYNYAPDTFGDFADGTLWVSDSNGLPLRQEIRESGTLPNRRVARSISVTYSYNADVVAPSAAVHAENTRLFINQMGIP